MKTAVFLLAIFGFQFSPVSKIQNGKYKVVDSGKIRIYIKGTLMISFLCYFESLPFNQSFEKTLTVEFL